MKKSKILYLCGIITSILIIIVILIFLSIQKNKSQLLGQTVQMIDENQVSTTKLASTSQDKTINETDEFSKIEEQKNEKIELEKVINTTESESKRNDTKENKVVEESKKAEQLNSKITFVAPVDGEILRNYAKDKLVYSDTLKEWVTHLGIDIKAPKTTIVKASSKGKISAIKNDPRFGLSIVIEHTDGYVTIYSNLLTAEFVTIGEEVEQGETIGTVGNTAAFEILDEPHLHFEILKDGVQIDPNMYL